MSEPSAVIEHAVAVARDIVQQHKRAGLSHSVWRDLDLGSGGARESHHGV
jgi:hypothetical protein